MTRLRNSKPLTRLVALLIVLGLATQGAAVHLAASLPDGICYADDTPTEHPATPDHGHDPQCLLCFIPDYDFVSTNPSAPLPGLAGILTPAPKRPASPAPRPAPAFYASRAPPRAS